MHRQYLSAWYLAAAADHSSHVHTSEREVIDGVRDFVGHAYRRRGFDGSHLSRRGAPTRIQQLSELYQSQALTRAASASEVENDRRFHWCEESVASAGSAVVEEVGLVNAPIFRLRRCFTNDASTECQNQWVLLVHETHRSTMSMSMKR